MTVDDCLSVMLSLYNPVLNFTVSCVPMGKFSGLQGFLLGIAVMIVSFGGLYISANVTSLSRCVYVCQPRTVELLLLLLLILLGNTGTG